MSQRLSRVRLQDRLLVDRILQSPVDRYLARKRRRFRFALMFILVVLVGWFAWRFLSDRPVDYRQIDEHFKYGSVGTEPGGSLLNPVGGLLPPYWIFRALPDVCPDRLPGGYPQAYVSLGLIYEDGMDRPVGISRRRRLGIDQAGVNCALCHAGTVRGFPQEESRVVLGMPANGLSFQDLFRSILSCVEDRRFTADNVVDRIQQAGGRLDLLDRLLYRYVVIPRTRQGIAELRRDAGAILGEGVTDWGRGRTDTFTIYKSAQFSWNLEQLPPSELIAAVDLPSIWNQKPRQGMQLHWDGNNTSVEERNLSAALGVGVTPVTIDHRRAARVADWAWTLAPPLYPYAIDLDLARRGEVLYARHCRECHADHGFRRGVVRGSKVGKVVPVEQLGTDPHRFNSYTYAVAANQNTLFAGSDLRFKHFTKTKGYANQPLDGIWLRAPYLHNGSVPTLRHLLEPPDKRPQVFYRGNDLYDSDRVGFVFHLEAHSGGSYFRYDTRLPGNSNGGHLYGTDLTDAEKTAIVEYMKKF